MSRKPSYVPKSTELAGGPAHIAYEYSSLVFAGEHTLKAKGDCLDVLAQNAFLMTCREFAEFFAGRSSKPDMKAAHYCKIKSMPSPSVRTWKKWSTAIDRQVAHLSYRRVTHPKEWVGHDGTNKGLLDEFRRAFRTFLDHADDRSVFDKELSKRSAVIGLPLP